MNGKNEVDSNSGSWYNTEEETKAVSPELKKACVGAGLCWAGVFL